MTIGRKIAQLRAACNMSQEKLAESLSVSRQSVSKWEIDRALPQVDKILQMCKLFGVSTDSLLRPESIPEAASDITKAGKYFGTDGFRGEANVSLTAKHAFLIGRFLGWYYGSELSGRSGGAYRPRIVIGKDTRRSSYMLEYAIAAGITSSGADAYMLHVITTPGVSYTTAREEFDCGIMITASHNPYYDNGIKIVNRYGEKLDDKTTALIERYIDGDLSFYSASENDLPLAGRDKVGQIVDWSAGRNRYIAYLIALASHSFKNLKIGLDCANGASWMIAKSVFAALGAQTSVIGAEPDGLNVNRDCGSTHIEQLCALVKEQHLDVGFAFDGDSDRLIAVDENGSVVDGDKILYVLAKRLKKRGTLNNDTVVATVMSNSGFVSTLEKEGIKCVQTSVGDRFVYEEMQKNDYSLGGEQSGHIIIKKYATTGDGILTAIMLTEEMCDNKTSLSKLTEQVTLFPQYMKSVKVKDKDAALSDNTVLAEKAKAEELICGKGRVLLRKSGTEPVVRIMVEAESKDKCETYTDMIYNAMLKGGYCVE